MVNAVTISDCSEWQMANSEFSKAGRAVHAFVLRGSAYKAPFDQEEHAEDENKVA